MLFADMALYDGEEVTLGKVLQPKVEAEIAFVLERDLTQSGASLADVISAIAYALPAVEIVPRGFRGKTIDWDVDDPVGRSLTTFRRVRGEIDALVKKLVEDVRKNPPQD